MLMAATLISIHLNVYAYLTYNERSSNMYTNVEKVQISLIYTYNCLEYHLHCI